METGEDEGDEPLGHMTGDLDLNDNNHIITRHGNMDHTQNLKPPNEEHMTTMVGVHGSPNRCHSHSPTISDNTHQVSGLLYSPEDTINNDFFYDDEFAVQFDATLGGMEEEGVLDALDLDGLLRMAGDDNQRWRTRMTTSKSDSCLYQAELDFSDCSDQNRSSSERDLLTSSDLSDFKAEPLFSPPPPGELDDSCGVLQTDSICNEELAGSLVKDEDRYAFDWTANKDRYMISFDRSPTKHGEDDLYHEPPAKKLSRGMSRSRDMSTDMTQEVSRQMTCWGQRSTSSGGSDRSSGRSSSGRSSSGRSSSGRSSSGRSSTDQGGSTGRSSCSSGPYSTANSGISQPSSGPLSSEMIAYTPPTSPSGLVSNGNNSSRGISSTDTSSSSTMTTWKLLRQHSQKANNLPDGMTTWQHIRAGAMTCSATRSKSMPDLQTPAAPDPRPTQESALLRERSPGREDTRPKRYSASLLEMYRKLKADQGELRPYCEPESVPEVVSCKQFEMDTWSMSPASSHQMSPMEVSGRGITDSSLIQWTQAGTGAAVCRDNVSNVGTDVYQNERLRGVTSHCQRPIVNDCGVQTSFEKCANPKKEPLGIKLPENKTLKDKTSQDKSCQHKSLQTSWELLTGAHIRIHRTQRHGYPSFMSRLPRPHSMGSIHLKKNSIDDDRFTVHLSQQAKERMTRSLFFNSTVLPDLSFLKKKMSCSIANLTQTLHQAPDKNKRPLGKSQHPITIPARAAHPQHSDISSGGYRPKKPPRQRRPLSACISGSHSRDSSPVLLGAKHRSRSTDSASSFCSSSSSGIDPGSYDSHRSGHYFLEHHSRRDDHHRWPHHESKVIIAKGHQGNHGEHMSGNYGNSKEGVWLRHDGRTAKVCNICRAHYQSEAEDDDQTMTVSHPSYRPPAGEQRCRKSSSEEGFSSWTSCDCSRVSPVCHQVACGCVECAPCMCMYQEVCGGQSATCAECHQVCSAAVRCQHRLRHYCHNSKPLKSCLVKRRIADHKQIAFKRRSWSDPSDGIVLKYSQEGQIRYRLVTHDKECTRRQPLSEIKIQEQSPETDQSEKTILDECQNSTEPTNKAKPPCCLDYKPSDKLVNPVKVKCAGIQADGAAVVPSNSPDQIPVPPCTCGTTHAVLHSSSDSGEGVGHSLSDMHRTSSDIYRNKKSVSFSEEISYHSPYNSPNHSPKRQACTLVAKDTGTGVVIRHPLGRHLSPKRRPVSLPPDFRLMGPVPTAQAIPEVDTPPTDFAVSPPSCFSITPSASDTNVNLIHMKGVVRDMVKATQHLINYYSKTRDTQGRIELVTSRESVDVGQIVLQYLCPAVYAVVQDGLHPHVRSLFGNVKNSPWRVVQDSLDLITSQVIRDLVRDLKTLDYLSTAWLKFNAFVFGLLNNKVLDVWLTQLQTNSQLLQRHYEAESFLQLSTTPSGRRLFLDLITIIQPLAGMPFRLEYRLECRLLESRSQEDVTHKADKSSSGSSSDESQVANEGWLLEQKQAARLKQLAHSGSTSPIRGEISPVQGDEGQPEGVLHHSAPAAYHEQQVALYSPAKAHWQSLYNKVQQLKTSDIALHTKTLVSESFKSLKDSTTLKLSGTTLKMSKDALQSLGQDLVLAAVGYSSPVRALPKVPGLTESGDSSGPRHSNSSSTSTIADHQGSVTDNLSSRRRAVPVSDRQITDDDSDSGEKTDSFIQKVSQRLIGYNSPQRAYKQGVTEYQFDASGKDRPMSLPSSKSLDTLSKVRASKSRIPVRSASMTQRQSLFDENGMPRCASLEESIEFMIPSRAESIDSPTTPPEDVTEATAPPTQQPPQMKHRAKKFSKKLGSSLKRSWSSFGPKLVSFMDQLLLEDNKKKAAKKSRIPTAAHVVPPTVSSSSTSSGSSSPPSVIHKPNAKPISSPTARPPLRKSTTIGPCESSTELQRQPEPLLVIESGTTVTNTAAATTSRKQVLPPKDRHEHHWFVQALCHHVAMQDDQLSYDKGTVFAVIKQMDSHWLLCRHGNKEGLVHTACVTKA